MSKNNTNFQDCINCDDGYVKMLGTKFPCPVCKGLRMLEVPKGKKICPTCKGTGGTYGLAGTACKECHGTKFVDNK